MIYFFNLKGRVTETMERERERERVFIYWFTPRKAIHGRGWAGLKPGTRSFFRVCHTGAVAQGPELLLLLQAISRELDRGMKQLRLNSVSICDASTAGRL